MVGILGGFPGDFSCSLNLRAKGQSCERIESCENASNDDIPVAFCRILIADEIAAVGAMAQSSRRFWHVRQVENIRQQRGVHQSVCLVNDREMIV